MEVQASDKMKRRKYHSRKTVTADEGEVLRILVVSHGAEFLVQGYLMRRNLLTYKAAANNKGYDLIRIHPDPEESHAQIPSLSQKPLRHRLS